MYGVLQSIQLYIVSTKYVCIPTRCVVVQYDYTAFSSRVENERNIQCSLLHELSPPPVIVVFGVIVYVAYTYVSYRESVKAVPIHNSRVVQYLLCTRF